MKRKSVDFSSAYQIKRCWGESRNETSNGSIVAVVLKNLSKNDPSPENKQKKEANRKNGESVRFFKSKNKKETIE